MHILQIELNMMIYKLIFLGDSVSVVLTTKSLRRLGTERYETQSGSVCVILNK